MSRIRTVKPEILEDSVTAGLDDMAFRLFIACISLADDYGRLRAEPGWLMGQVYWSRPVDRAAFEISLAALVPLVRFYSVNGQRYAEIRNWAKHQRVDKPGKPRVPPPTDDVEGTLAKPSRDSRESLAPDPDLGPPTTTPTKDPACAERVLGPDGDSGVMFAAYTAGVRDATGRPMTALQAQDRKALVAFVNAHAGGLTGELLEAWVRKIAAEFAKQHDPTFGGFSPVQCAKWLDSGCKVRAPPGGKHVQSAENRAWIVPKDMP